MRFLSPAILIFILLSFLSCEKTPLEEILPDELTDSEIVAGLKEALRVGTDTSVSTVSKLDGYYKDQAIKILLPPEADIVYDGINTLKGNALTKIVADELEAQIENVILSINRSAEDAAKSAAPIFWNAITNISIADGKNILFGGIDTAATSYLKDNTFDSLYTTFKPTMTNSLDKPIVAGASALSTWNSFTSKYNTAVSTYNAIPLIGGNLKEVNTELDDFVTRKGLNGLFVKVADEEKKIRENPLNRVTDILKNVFGKLD